MCRTVSFGDTERWVGNAGFGESNTEDVVKWFLFVFKPDIKSSQSDPVVMVKLRGEATGTWSFSITVKSLSIMSEGTAE